MKKQTAVEWVDEQLEKQLELFQSEWEKVNKLFEQAKAMEKEQMKEMYLKGVANYDSNFKTKECKGGDK
jgi:hypothetical protein